MKKLLRFLFSRAFLFSVPLLLQALALIIVIWRFSNYFVYFYAICTLLSVGAVLKILRSRSNPAYKIAWVVPIIVFPIFGGLFYLIFGINRLSKRAKQKMHAVEEKMTELLGQNKAVLQAIELQDRSAANLARYIENYSFCPVYQNTVTEFLTPGERMFERLLEELKKAERYIFLEYFIIDRGEMWDAILEILRAKAGQGVDVRIIYDDVGCLLTLPYGYNKQLEKMGIKCFVFNPLVPILTARLNNRDHRKIAVIDGKTAITGGINLADEYINAYERFGHWKDSAILLQGEAVWSFTVMFLSLWNYQAKGDEDYVQFKVPELFPELSAATSAEMSCGLSSGRPSEMPSEAPSEMSSELSPSEVLSQLSAATSPAGYVQPFGDSPLDDESIGETVFLNLINRAKRYLYINTPYLILDNGMANALCSAAKRSVDVRIITPHIPDKWFVHSVTRSNYDILVESGVRIYEYTPGFNHAKTIVVDDEMAVVGTINFDYRSLFLHFECGVWLYQTPSIQEVKDDFLQTLDLCQEITLADCRAVRWYKRLGRSLLRAFAPLM